MKKNPVGVWLVTVLAGAALCADCQSVDFQFSRAKILPDIPLDFPVITVHTSAAPAPGYIFLSNFPLGTNANTPYLMMLDNAGYPVQYRACDAAMNFDFKIQPSQQPGFLKIMSMDITNETPVEVNCAWLLDAQLQNLQMFQVTNTLPPMPLLPGRPLFTDPHEFRLLSNENALLMGWMPARVNMSLRVPGGQTNALVMHTVIQEISTNGAIAWEWRTDEHFDVLDATPDVALTAPVIDYAHCNALEIDHDGHLLLSSRHMDEITKINRDTGEIIWRWGGMLCSNNQFRFVNDTVHDAQSNVLFFGFSHQHGIRRLPNGNVLLFDNGNLKSPPVSRAVEYYLNEDPVNLTATLVWAYTNNPAVMASAMGYAQRLDNGNTVIGWGWNSNSVGQEIAVTEVTPQGEKVFELSLPRGICSYRAYRFVYEMDAVTLPVDKPDVYTFNDNVYTTHLALAVQTLAGTGSVTVARHRYAPHNPEYEGAAAPRAIHPWRWVVTSTSDLNYHSGVVRFVMDGLPDITLPTATVVYHRPREGEGIFTPLPTMYDFTSRVLAAAYVGDGELMLGARAMTVAADYDGDGKSDLAVYRNGYWSIFSLANGLILNNAGEWGGADCTPVPGDYDGDGKSDLAFYRDGYWSIFSLDNGLILNNAGEWGGADWTPVPGDYDGDGKSDLAVYRNGYWSIFSLDNGLILNNAGEWGGADCTPVPGDYDGDGKSDLAFYRDGYWSIFSLDNGIILLNAGEWGGADCTPVPGDYDGDAKSDLAFYRNGHWSIFSLANGLILNNAGEWGGADCIPVPGDYDGDGKSDLAFYRNGYWSIFSLANGLIINDAGEWGGAGWEPVR